MVRFSGLFASCWSNVLVIVIFFLLCMGIGCSTACKVLVSGAIVGASVNNALTYEHTGDVDGVEVRDKDTMIRFKDGMSYEVKDHPTVRPGDNVSIKKVEKGYEAINHSRP